MSASLCKPVAEFDGILSIDFYVKGIRKHVFKHPAEGLENRGGIQERTVGLRFLGIILRVLRLEVSTLVLCLSTRCSS
jgi:hypothetical protein